MSEQTLAAAQRYVEVGQPERALEALGRLDSDTAVSPRARCLRGYALYGSERFADAADAARDGLQDDPDAPELLLLLSLAAEQLGRLDEAESAILAALAQQPDDAQLLGQYADVCMRGGQLDKAQRLLDAADGFEPGSPDVLSGRISLAYLRGDDRRARKLTKQLLATDPEDVRAHRMLGALEANQGRMAAAAQRFGEAVRQDPSHHPTADSARRTRTLARWWWAPARVITRLGVIGSWMVAMGIIFGLRGLGYATAASIAGVIWLGICIVSWIAPRD